ncbi:MAG: hypothetical protein WBE72_11535 [Terracidiphilus sp.]
MEDRTSAIFCKLSCARSGGLFTGANEVVEPIRDRMPVILAKIYSRWLGHGMQSRLLLDLPRSHPAEVTGV